MPTNRLPLVLLFLSVALLPTAFADDTCPVLLQSGFARENFISITFENKTSKPIRELRFDCKIVDVKADNAAHLSCYETKANFLPNQQYTTRYAIDAAIPGPVLVSVGFVVFSDGQRWTSPKRNACPVLKLRLDHPR